MEKFTKINEDEFNRQFDKLDKQLRNTSLVLFVMIVAFLVCINSDRIMKKLNTTGKHLPHTEQLKTK